MNRIFKRGLALFIVLVMCISMLPALSIKTSAATVNYVYDGNYIYNWGTRGTEATFLSPKAEAFYTKNNTGYDQLSAYSGGTGSSNAPSSSLYKALQSLMTKNHSYKTSYNATRDLYMYTDCQNSGLNSSRISSFYSGKEIGPSWDSGNTWNREHTWPNSKGLGGDDENDIMMLRPTATSENGSRGNTAYGKSSGYYFPNSASGGTYDVRGDVARIFLYVYVRWGNTSRAWGTSGVMENVTVLLEWMEADPVDTWELGRNDSVEAITGTRNVFVDYPELAFILFGEEIPDDMQTPSGEASEKCDHNNFDAGVVIQPTCTTGGYTLQTCQVQNCGNTRKVSIVVALGHNYTSGVCTRCGEQETVAPTEPTYAKQVVAGQPYKLGFYSTNKSAAYYFTGSMSTTNQYYGATDTSYDNGVDVYAETVTGGYRLYFMSNNQKQYINLVQSSTHYNFTFSTTPTSVFTWDATRCSFSTKVGSETCYIGNYGTYTNVGTLTSSKMSDTDYFAHFYTTTGSGTTPDETPCEHNYQNNECVKCGDVKACDHNYQNNECTICGKTRPSTSQATISFANTANRTQFSGNIQVWEQNGITITNDKAASQNNVADYADPARFYMGSKVTIEFTGMTKIVINCEGLESRYVDPWKSVPSGATVTTSGNVITITFSSPTDSFVYDSLSAQARAFDITVYAESAAVEEECKHTNTIVKDAIEATCTSDGFSGKTYCADCEELLNAGVTLPKVDHKLGEWSVTTEPTCTSKGVERRYCNNCNYNEMRMIAVIDHVDGNDDKLCDTCGAKHSTDAPSTDDGNNDDSTNATSGCQSVVGGTSFWLIALISTAAVMLTKKKEY